MSICFLYIRMQAVHHIQIKQLLAFFMIYIHNRTAGSDFQTVITTKPIRECKSIPGYMRAKYFTQFLAGWFRTVYCLRYYLAITLNTSTDIAIYSLEIPRFAAFAPCLRALRFASSGTGLPL